MAEARSILYLADNAGTIAIDRLLIEQFSPARIALAVRGAPVINDATMADARAVGLHEVVEIIDNRSDAPGTPLEDCNEDFTRRFSEADLVLAKEQGKFETLSEQPCNIFFLFKVKCPVIAAHVGLPVGTHVLAQSSDRPSSLEIVLTPGYDGTRLKGFGPMTRGGSVREQVVPQRRNDGENRGPGLPDGRADRRPHAARPCRGPGRDTRAGGGGVGLVRGCRYP